MGLAITADYVNLSTSGAGRLFPSRGGELLTDGNRSEKSGCDSIQLSAKSRLLSQELILPTRENVARLSADLSGTLGAFLSRSGIDAQPPIEFSLDANGEIQVEGNRSDRERILEKVNSDEGMKKQIRTLAAISSHAVAMEESLRFQSEYRASSDPAAVVAKYSYLFNSGQPLQSVSLRFDGNTVDVMANGNPWLSAA